MPLIVQSINAEDPGLISSTLKTLSLLVTDAPDMVSEHVSAFFPALLRLTTFKPRMVRLLFIYLLFIFIIFRQHVLLWSNVTVNEF